MYETRLRVVGLVSLEELRRVKDLVTCYKYINGFIDVDTHHFSPARCLRTRSTHDQKLQIQFCQTNCFKFSFLKCVVPAWNSLLLFLFLLRILFCLKNICPCITTLAISRERYMLYQLRFVVYVFLGCTHYCFFLFLG